MKFDINNWNEIYQTLSRNKSRTFLTAFGVFWGIFMLVLLMGLGAGFKQVMSGNFKGISQNLAIVFPRTTSKPYKGFQKGRSWSLENRDLTALTDQVPEITSICPIIWVGGTTAVFQEKKFDATVMGISNIYVDCEKPDMLYGRFINEIDEKEGRKNCVLGDKVYNSLFPKGEDPLGKYINAKNVYYQIVGVTKGESKIQFGGSQTERIVIPFNTAQTIYNKGDKLDFIMVNAKPNVPIKEFKSKAEHILKAAHYVHPDDDKALFFLDTGAMFSMLSNFMSNIDKLVWLVGLGTLLAGVIGVSNIMLITVRERTSEFGIRRAIGALPIDILGQILSESIAITIVSGLLGLSFATLCLSGVEYAVELSMQKELNFQISFLQAIGVSSILAILGAFAGASPAYRAMSIKPIDAIRDE